MRIKLQFNQFSTYQHKNKRLLKTLSNDIESHVFRQISENKPVKIKMDEKNIKIYL